MRNTSLRMLAGAAAVTGILISGGPAQAACLVTLETGHVDVVGLAYEEGELEIAVHAETGEEEVEYAPEDTLLRVLPAAKTTIPDGDEYAFLGTAGRPVWILPQVQNPDLLFAGFGAEELESGVLQDDEVDVSFLSVQGPGKLAVYTDGVFGQPESILVNSGDGLPDTVGLQAGEHTHANWAFTKPGTYKVKVKAAAHLAADGTPVVSDVATYTFEVKK
ncbi:choice-of-anchor M domain-containing protein [Streptomyces sp. NPDC052023]|uniref:choice-of-anchor M domain-containing protein n=1 Tax=Streptomyces sp. NPDC052023 TaxID=3365681 RepID=UPI0037D5BFAB